MRGYADFDDLLVGMGLQMRGVIDPHEAGSGRPFGASAPNKVFMKLASAARSWKHLRVRL